MKSNSQVDFEISDEDMKILKKFQKKLKAMVKVVSSRYTEEKCKMKKPYIICHMMTSVDGRIDCAMTSKLSGVSDYYTTLAQINVPTTVSGRVTART